MVRIGALAHCDAILGGSHVALVADFFLGGGVGGDFHGRFRDTVSNHLVIQKIHFR